VLVSVCKTDEYIGKDDVVFVTNEGRVLSGRLEGFDPVGNVVISDCREDGVKRGVLVLRGDFLSLVGELKSGNVTQQH
jgi:small nuclear ribonucleoprotein (snRNP)-like protein